MNRRGQRDKITQFRAITTASEKVAKQCLQQGEWDVEAAVDYFYANPSLFTDNSFNVAGIEQLFRSYKDRDSDMILVDGITKLCSDLQVDPTDVVLVVFSYHLGAATMCEYSRDEFVNGMVRLNCDSIAKLRALLPQLRAELGDTEKFKEIYNFAYAWSCDKGQKCLQLETAVAMWTLLFAGPQKWDLLGDWLEFVQSKHKRPVSKDTWQQLLDFRRVINADFSNYNEDGAWPYLIDEFVEHMRESRS